MGYVERRLPVTVLTGEATALTFELAPAASELTGIEVVAIRDGQARALQQQSSAPNITNIVPAD